jgi:hypothetical protein
MVGMARPALAVTALVALLVAVTALALGTAKVPRMALRTGQSEEMAVAALTALLVAVNALAPLGTARVMALRPGQSGEMGEMVGRSLGTELGHSYMELDIVAQANLVVSVTEGTLLGVQPLEGVLRYIRSEGTRLLVQILEIQVGRPTDH